LIVEGMSDTLRTYRVR